MSKQASYIFYLFVVFFLHACQTDISPSRNNPLADGKVLLSGELSYSGQITLTRSVYESDIYRLDIMMFDEEGTFVEWHQANILASGMGTCEYNSVFTATDCTRILHYFVNYPFEDQNLVTSYLAGMHMSEVMALIVDQSQYNDGGDHIMTMWGTCNLSSIKSNTIIPSVSLIRSAAKLSLEIPVELRNQFSLDKFSLYNSMATGLLAPASFSSNPADWIRASEPRIRILDTLRVESANNYSAQLYTYERRIESSYSDEACFIIIKGRYGDDPFDDYSYYKILLAAYDESESDPVLRFKPLDIFRNTHYKLSLKRIEGRGYPTLEQALTSPPLNNIVIETLSSTSDVQDEITNGQYKLGLSCNSVNLYEEPLSNTYTKIANIYVNEVELGATGGLSPGMEEVYCIIESNDNNLLLTNNNLPYNVGDTLLPSSEGELWVLINTYQQGLNRRGRIRVQAGNLCRQIELSQSRYSLFNLPEVLYVGWEIGSIVNITVVPDSIQHYPLEIYAGLGNTASIWNNEDYEEPPAAFLNINQNMHCIENATSAQQCSFAATTTSVFNNPDIAAYRVQEVILRAEGFLNDTVLVKQARYP